MVALLCFQGKTPVYEGDDLATVLEGAADGANIVLVSGSFVLGDYALNKSVIISGYFAKAGMENFLKLRGGAKEKGT